MVKRLVALCFAAVLSSSFIASSNVSAVVVPPDRPAYSYTSDCSSSISISNSTATCKSYIRGYFNVTTKIEVEQTLQKKNSSGKWVDVCSWNNTINYFQGTVTNYAYSLSSGTYRLKSVFTVYSGNNHETITNDSSEKTK